MANQDNSTSKMLTEMGLDKKAQTKNVKTSVEQPNPSFDLNQKRNNAKAIPQTSVSPDMGDVITNILNLSHSKKHNPMDK